jgi:hypothetical protein
MDRGAMRLHCRRRSNDGCLHARAMTPGLAVFKLPRKPPMASA